MIKDADFILSLRHANVEGENRWFLVSHAVIFASFSSYHACVYYNILVTTGNKRLEIII